MLLKEFSHILNNTNLLTTSAIDVIKTVSKNEVIKLPDISSKFDKEFAPELGRLVEDANIESEDSDTTIYNKDHYLLAFDQTRVQTQIISKYLQILCDKYGVKETDIDFDVSPIYKNNKLWLLYTFKISELTSKDGIDLNIVKTYDNVNDEYHIMGKVKAGASNIIYVYISDSNNIKYYEDMTYIIDESKTKSYTLYTLPNNKDGEDFDFTVKKGCCILFRADYCKDVALINVEQNVSVNINLAYDKSLETNINMLELVPSQNILNNEILRDYKYLDKVYKYKQDNPMSIELVVNSINQTEDVFTSNVLQYSLLVATHFEEDITHSDYKKWTNVLKANTNSVKTISGNKYIVEPSPLVLNLLHSINLPEALFQQYLNDIKTYNIKEYISSFYVKPALYDNTLNKLVLPDFGNIINIEFTFINDDPNAVDIKTLNNEAVGNRLVISVKNDQVDNIPRCLTAPEMLEQAYIYSANDKMPNIPNFVIPTRENKLYYLAEGNSWISYNGYYEDTFKIRTAFCRNDNIYKRGYLSNTVSFVIDYISYFIDNSVKPEYFYIQTLEVIDNNSNVISRSEEYLNNNTIYDIRRTKLYISNLNISNLTTLKLRSVINKYFFRKSSVVENELVTRDDNGNYTKEGILNNGDDTNNLTTSLTFNDDGKMVLYLSNSLLNESYNLYFENQYYNILEAKRTASIIYHAYDSVRANKLYLIKKFYTDPETGEKTNNVAIQNIFPDDIDHIGIYFEDEVNGILSKNKITNISFSESSKLKNKETTDPLLKLGFLSDIHFNRSAENANDTNSPQSRDDFANAMKYFYKNNIYTVYSAGDLTAADAYSQTEDLQDFKEHLDEVINNINTSKLPGEPDMKIYISRGNHDMGCICDTPEDINSNYADSSLRLQEYDYEWITYLQSKDITEDTTVLTNWQYGYYMPANDNDFIDNPNDEDDTGLLLLYDDKAPLSAGYNVHYLGGSNTKEDHTLKLVVIALPIYANNFWQWNLDNNIFSCAYANEEIYKLEQIIRKFYKQPKTEIIVITHIQFDNNTGNYKKLYNFSKMDHWYGTEQYEILKDIHDAYDGIIWMEGHTHIKYEMQGEKLKCPIYPEANLDYFDNANVSCEYNVFDIHIGSCAYPRIQNSNRDNLKNLWKESQGLTFDIYEDHIIIKGISFKLNDEQRYHNAYVPVGMYRLNFCKNKQDVENPISEYYLATNYLTRYIPD